MIMRVYCLFCIHSKDIVLVSTKLRFEKKYPKCNIFALTSCLFIFGEVVRHVLQGDNLPPEHFVLLFQIYLLQI